MSEATHEVRDYRIDFSSYAAFIGVWLERFTFGRKNLIRFGIYAVALLIMLSWSSAKSTINGKPVDFSAGFALSLTGVVNLLGSLTLAAFLAYILAPSAIFVWQTVTWALKSARATPVSLAISPDGLAREGAASLPWDAVHEVAETSKTILVFANPNSATIIPKAAFPTPEAERAFFEAAQSWWIRANR